MMNHGQQNIQNSDFINYKTDNLTKFLKEINELR